MSQLQLSHFLMPVCPLLLGGYVGSVWGEVALANKDRIEKSKLEGINKIGVALLITCGIAHTGAISGFVAKKMVDLFTMSDVPFETCGAIGALVAFVVTLKMSEA